MNTRVGAEKFPKAVEFRIRAALAGSLVAAGLAQ
jgi:hypothetical protein